MFLLVLIVIKWSHPLYTTKDSILAARHTEYAIGCVNQRIIIYHNCLLSNELLAILNFILKVQVFGQPKGLTIVTRNSVLGQNSSSRVRKSLSGLFKYASTLPFSAILFHLWSSTVTKKFLNLSSRTLNLYKRI